MFRLRQTSRFDISYTKTFAYFAYRKLLLIDRKFFAYFLVLYNLKKVHVLFFFIFRHSKKVAEYECSGVPSVWGKPSAEPPNPWEVCVGQFFLAVSMKEYSDPIILYQTQHRYMTTLQQNQNLFQL